MLKRLSAVILSTGIAAVIIAYMLIRVWDELIIAFRNAILLYLVVAALICVAAWILRGFRYRFILAGVDIPASPSLATATIFVSQTANLIVPARLGDFVRMIILKHEVQAPYSRSFSSLVVERVFDIITVAALGLLALPFVVDVPEWFLTLIIVPLIGGGIFFLVLLLAGRMTSENRYLQMILRLCTEVRNASLNLKALSILSAESLLIWVVDTGVCIVVAAMFREIIPVPIIILAIVIGNLVKAVPLTPGGVGTYELSLALTFELAGVPAAIATLIAVIDHLIKNLVTLGGGVISIYLFGDWSVALLKRVYRRDIRREEFQ